MAGHQEDASQNEGLGLGFTGMLGRLMYLNCQTGSQHKNGNEILLPEFTISALHIAEESTSP